MSSRPTCLTQFWLAVTLGPKSIVRPTWVISSGPTVIAPSNCRSTILTLPLASSSLPERLVGTGTAMLALASIAQLPSPL